MTKSINEKNFKSVLGGYITGVTIVVTVDDNGNFHGFTANSFNSVSLNPPLVSFCLHNDSSTMAHLVKQRSCVISILSQDQQEISKHFAFHQDDKFADMDYDISPSLNYPIMKNAVGWLECKIVDIHPAGDHHIFISQVEQLYRDQTVKPLVYYSGNYNQI